LNNLDETSIYNVNEINEALTLTILDEVYSALEERGYNPISQMVGYLLSNDPGYITSYKDARNKIMGLERSVIVEMLLRNYLKKWDI